MQKQHEQQNITIKVLHFKKNTILKVRNTNLYRFHHTFTISFEKINDILHLLKYTQKH